MIPSIYPTDAQLAVSPYFASTPIFTPAAPDPTLPATEPQAAAAPAAPRGDSIDISLEARVRSLDSLGLTPSQIATMTGVAEATVQFYRGELPTPLA